jgi:hypothetical protein
LEVAHVVLGHTTNIARLEDGAVISRAAAEVEAESVTLLALGSLRSENDEDLYRCPVEAHAPGRGQDERPPRVGRARGRKACPIRYPSSDGDKKPKPA